MSSLEMGWDILMDFWGFGPSYRYCFEYGGLKDRRIKISKAPRVISEIYFVSYISLTPPRSPKVKAVFAADGT